MKPLWLLMPRTPCGRCRHCKEYSNGHVLLSRRSPCFFEELRHMSVRRYFKTKLGIEFVNVPFLLRIDSNLYDFVTDQTVSRTRQRPEFSPYSYDFVLRFVSKYAEKGQGKRVKVLKRRLRQEAFNTRVFNS